MSDEVLCIDSSACSEIVFRGKIKETYKPGKVVCMGQLWGIVSQPHEIYVVMDNDVQVGLGHLLAHNLTGAFINASESELILLDRVDSQKLAITVEKCGMWAESGSSNAMAWMGWYYETDNYAVSTWYYLAAMRRNRSMFASYADQVFYNALSHELIVNKLPLEKSYLHKIPEVLDYINDFLDISNMYSYFETEDGKNTVRIGDDWREAIMQAIQLTK